MTIPEVLVAAVILAISALAVLALTDTATRNTYRAEESQVVVDRLQAELEHIRQLPFNQVALTSAPQTSNEVGSPAQRVSGTQFALNRDGSNPKPLAIGASTAPSGKTVGCGGSGEVACGVSPGPEPFSSGDVQGQIYRYVVYPGAPSTCTGCSADDMKRVIVAISLDATAAGGTRTYQEIQSNVGNPDAVPSTNPTPPCDPTKANCDNRQVTTFWLTDTPCSQTSRQALTGNHDAHNTRGAACTGSAQTGATRGPPDLMFNQRPPDSDASNSFLYDYATDVEPPTNPGSDIGLAVLRTQSQNGCPLGLAVSGSSLNRTLDMPSSEPNPQLATHMWLSNELNDTFTGLTSADSTLELWTKSVNGASYSGNICATVFKRFTVVQTLLGVQTTFVVDAPATLNLTSLIYGTYQQATWPQDWKRISVPMHLQMVSGTDLLNQLSGQVPGTLSLTAQPRLGLAVSVEKEGTTGNGLEFMYDHPTFDSRLEVDTPLGVCLAAC